MKCPDCSNEVRDYIKVCQFCGHIFEENIFENPYDDIIKEYKDKYSNIPVNTYKTRQFDSKIIFKNFLTDNKSQEVFNNLSPEEFTINFYKQKGYHAFFAENKYWIILLLMIYEYKEFISRSYIYELLSTSILFDQTFLDKIDNIDFESLNRISNITNRIIEAYFGNIRRIMLINESYNSKIKKYGLNDNFTVDDFIVANSYLTNEQLILIFERIGDDFKYYAFGLPDLIVYNDDEFFFVEVKSKGDVPSSKQVQWHKFLSEVVGIDVVLFMIEKTNEQIQTIEKKYDVELFDSKKRKALNKKLNKEPIFIDWNDDRLKNLIFKVDSKEFERIIGIRVKYKSIVTKKYVVNDYTWISHKDFERIKDWTEYNKAVTKGKYDLIYKAASKLYHTNSFEDYRPTKKQFERNQKAKSLENEGKYSEALKLYLENVMEKTGSPVTYKRLIYILNKFNRFDDIVNLMDIAIPIFITLNDKKNVIRFLYQKFSAMNDNKWVDDLSNVPSNDSKIKQDSHKKDKQSDLSSYFN